MNPLSPRLWSVLGREALLFGPAAWALWTSRRSLSWPLRLLQLALLVASATYWLR